MDKDKKSNKKVVVILSILLGLIVIVAGVFIFLYLSKPKYEIKVNTDGHKIIKDMVIKDNVIEKLPELELKDNEDFIGWVNKDNKVMREKIKLERDEEITPIIPPKPREIVTVKFVTDTDEVIPDIKLTKGDNLLLPVNPSHKTWTFQYWVDKDGYIASSDKIITEDLTLYAYWSKPDKKEVTISFDTGTDEKIEPIKIMQGKKIIFPYPTVNKEDSKFFGWLDKDNNLVTHDTVANEDMKLTAKWVPNYTCPDNCKVSEDGKTCTREDITDPSTQKVCPGTLYYGNCINLNDKESANIRQCSSWEDGDEVDYFDGNEGWCVKKIPFVDKQVCPDGYNMTENKCVKEEVIECNKN